MPINLLDGSLRSTDPVSMRVPELCLNHIIPAGGTSLKEQSKVKLQGVALGTKLWLPRARMVQVKYF